MSQLSDQGSDKFSFTNKNEVSKWSTLQTCVKQMYPATMIMMVTIIIPW